MKKVKLSEHAKSIIISVGISIIAMCALMAALFSANFLLGALVASYDPALCWYMSATAIALVGVYNFVIVHRLEYKLLKIGRLSIAGIYVVLAILLAIFGSKEYAFTVVASIFFALRIALSVLDIISNHRKRDIVRNFFVVLIFAFCLTFSIVMLDIGAVILLAIAIMFISLYAIVNEAFQKIRFATIREIVKRTYALEIMLGLASLIISFSFVFYINEEMPYGDALWYCFAIVTTIGFGDVTVTSPLSRILSVILGIYGIVVVALITSIIVNFYNETKYVGKRSEKDKLEGESEDDEKKEE